MRGLNPQSKLPSPSFTGGLPSGMGGIPGPPLARLSAGDSLRAWGFVRPPPKGGECGAVIGIAPSEVPLRQKRRRRLLAGRRVVIP